MKQKRPLQNDEPRWLKITLTIIAVAFVVVMLILPLVVVFIEALSRGWNLYIAALTEPEAINAFKLTLLVTAIVVPLNTVFGISLAWLITRYKFKGKHHITTLLDLPFAISPVTAGLMFVLMFAANTMLGGWLQDNGMQIIYAVPGVVLATMFVTFPFVARELIPLMQSQGVAQEQAALTLGASGWSMFWRVTLPNIRWALLYGIILTNARAIGEFGAVSVVSGTIRNLTVTVPLLVQIDYDEYNFVAAFAVSSLLALFALMTLLLQNLLSWLQERRHEKPHKKAGRVAAKPLNSVSEKT